MTKCQGGVLVMTLSLALVMGIYSMYLLQQVSQSLEWQNRLMLSRNQLDLELDNALTVSLFIFQIRSHAKPLLIMFLIAKSFLRIG